MSGLFVKPDISLHRHERSHTLKTSKEMICLLRRYLSDFRTNFPVL